MIRHRLLGSIAAVWGLFLGGCLLLWEDSYTPERLRETVKPMRDGEFIVYFPVPAVDRLDSHPSVAVRKYLEANGLIPTTCTKGVTILGRDVAQGGYHGAATFRCAE